MSPAGSPASRTSALDGERYATSSRCEGDVISLIPMALSTWAWKPNRYGAALPVGRYGFETHASAAGAAPPPEPGPTTVG